MAWASCESVYAFYLVRVGRPQHAASDDREQASEASTVLVGGEGDQGGAQRGVAPTVADTGDEVGLGCNEGGAGNGASSVQDTVPVVVEGNTLNDIELAAIDAYAEQLKMEYDELERRVQNEAAGRDSPEEMEQFLVDKAGKLLESYDRGQLPGQEGDQE